MQYAINDGAMYLQWRLRQKNDFKKFTNYSFPFILFCEILRFIHKSILIQSKKLLNFIEQFFENFSENRWLNISKSANWLSISRNFWKIVNKFFKKFFLLVSRKNFNSVNEKSPVLFLFFGKKLYGFFSASPETIYYLV